MSSLRCKPGDLALVVAADITPEVIGKLVIVERPAINGEILNDFITDCESAAWVCTSVTRGQKLPVRDDLGILYNVPARVLLDRILRPIRPSEGEDESLSWARPISREAV